MWKRICDWLIKRLGGYTKAEYDDWSRIPVAKPVIQERCHRVETLRAVQTIHMNDLSTAWDIDAAGIRAKEMIVRRLGLDLTPYVQWHTSECYETMTIALEGRIAVMKEGL